MRNKETLQSINFQKLQGSDKEIFIRKKDRKSIDQTV
jgi:hypothetical protein